MKKLQWIDTSQHSQEYLKDFFEWQQIVLDEINKSFAINYNPVFNNTKPPSCSTAVVHQTPAIGSKWVDKTTGVDIITVDRIVRGPSDVTVDLTYDNSTKQKTYILSEFHKFFVEVVTSKNVAAHTSPVSAGPNKHPAIGSIWQHNNCGSKVSIVKRCMTNNTVEVRQHSSTSLISFDLGIFKSTFTEIVGAVVPSNIPNLGSKWKRKDNNLTITVKAINLSNGALLIDILYYFGGTDTVGIDAFNQHFIEIAEIGTDLKAGQEYCIGVDHAFDQALDNSPCTHEEWHDLVMFTDSVYVCKKCNKTKDEI